MSVTIIKSPDDFHSALRPSVWEFTSDRQSPLKRGVTTVGNSGGYAIMTTSFTHGYKEGDILIGSLFGIAGYNVTHTITSVTSTTFTTVTPYLGNSIGLVTRNNNNFQLKAGVRAFNGELIEISSIAAHAGGIEITTFNDHKLTGNEIILIDNTANYNGVYSVDLLTATNKLVVNAVYVTSEIGSIRTSELVAEKITTYKNDEVTAFSVSSVASSSGNAEFTTTSNHSFSVGDLVTGVGFSVVGYNGEQTVISVPSATKIVTSAAFVSNDIGVINTYPQPLFTFNFSGILISQLYGNRFDFGSSNLLRPALGNIIPYAIIVEEVFDDADGLSQTIIADSLLDLSPVKRGVLIALQHDEQQDLSYFTQENSSKKILTDSPSKLYKKVDEEIQLYILTTALRVRVRYERFDNNGASLGEAQLLAFRMYGNVLMIPVNTNLMTASHSRVDVWLVNADTTAQISEKKSIYRLTQCDGVRFHFLNQRGGYDQYTFTGHRISKVVNSKTYFTKQLPTPHSLYDKGSAVISVAASKQHECWSDYLNEETALWVEQLIRSSDVYVVINNTQEPIIITSNSMVIRDSEDMVRVKIEYIYANDLIQT